MNPNKLDKAATLRAMKPLEMLFGFPKGSVKDVDQLAEYLMDYFNAEYRDSADQLTKAVRKLLATCTTGWRGPAQLIESANEAIARPSLPRAV